MAARDLPTEPTPTAAAGVPRDGHGLSRETVAALAEADLAGVAELYARLRGRPELAQRVAPQMRAVYLDNPWRDDALPSLVSIAPDGRVSGFLGVIPRTMRYRDRHVRVAISSHFIVDPERRTGLTAIALLRRFFGGPQELSFADDATDVGRRVWEGLGGFMLPLLSLNWTRPLRPLGCALRLALRRRKRQTLAARAALLGAQCVDPVLRAAAPRSFRRFQADLGCEPLDADEIAAALAEPLGSERLAPVYDGASLRWLWRAIGTIPQLGTMHGFQLRGRDGRLAGWFMYFLKPGDIAETVQLHARPETREAVLEHLLADADRRGAAGVRGRLQPAFFETLSHRQCVFRRDGLWTLAHCRDPEVLDALLRGEALLTRLEGEWWVRFSSRTAPSA
jgi:hypothetical protein